MIRHIVVFKLGASEPLRRKAVVQEMALKLEGLVDIVPGILSIKVHEDLGIVPTHWEVILVSEYVSQAALDDYQIHPKHREVVEWINAKVVDRAVIDYEIT